MIDGKSYRFGAYKAQAKGNGKLAQGQEYYYFHRVEAMDAAQPAAGTLHLIQQNWRHNERR